MYLEVKNLVKSYNNSAIVINNLSFSVEQGQLISFVGESGSGKSTFLKCLSGLEIPNSGIISLNGEIINGDNIFVKPQNRKIGYVFQNYFLMPDLNALENVMIPSMIKGKNDDIERAVELLEKVGLGERLNHRPSELSGGEQQRVAIARALINDPEIIFADEPTGNLDSLTEEELMGTLMNLVTENKKTLIVVTHDSKLAKLGDRQLVLADGQIMA